MKKSLQKLSSLSHASVVIGQIEREPGVSSFYLTTGIGSSAQGNGPRDVLENKESWKLLSKGLLFSERNFACSREFQHGFISFLFIS